MNAWNNQNTSYKKAWVNKEENEEEKDNKMLSQNYQEKFGERRPGQTEEQVKEEKKAFNGFKKLRKEILSRGCGGLISLQRRWK